MIVILKPEKDSALPKSFNYVIQTVGRHSVGSGDNLRIKKKCFGFFQSSNKINHFLESIQH